MVPAARVCRLAGVGFEQPGGDPCERRLPGAVRPGERENLAAPHVQRGVLEDYVLTVGVADAADAAHDVRLVRQVERPVLGEPRQRIVARCVEDNPAAVHEEDAPDMGERPRRALLGHEHGARQVLDEVEERIRRLGVELRRRLVEQQQPRAQRERRGQRHALQLAAGELARHALGKMPRADQLERLLHALPDLA